MRSYALVACMLAVLVAAGCGGGGGTKSPSLGGTNPIVTSLTVTGRVVSTQTGNPGVAGVQVSFGQVQVLTASTDANGYFSIGLGADVTVATLYPTYPAYFAIDTGPAGSNYPTTEKVTLRGKGSYAQNAILIPTDVFTGGTTALGTITVTYVNGDDPDNPPAPPSFPDNPETPDNPGSPGEPGIPNPPAPPF